MAQSVGQEPTESVSLKEGGETIDDDLIRFKIDDVDDGDVGAALDRTEADVTSDDDDDGMSRYPDNVQARDHVERPAPCDECSCDDVGTDVMLFLPWRPTAPIDGVICAMCARNEDGDDVTKEVCV